MLPASLNTFVQKSNDQKFLIKQTTALDSKDVHAIDIHYHKNCWITPESSESRLSPKSRMNTPVQPILKKSPIIHLSMTESNLVRWSSGPPWRSKNSWPGSTVLGEVVELKEDRLFLARLMVCKSRPEVGIKETVRVHAYLAKAVKGRVKYWRCF